MTKEQKNLVAQVARNSKTIAVTKHHGVKAELRKENAKIRCQLRKQGIRLSDLRQEVEPKEKTPTLRKPLTIKRPEVRNTNAFKNRVEVTSASNPYRKYIVAVRASDGRFTCSCPHWKFRCNPAGTDCKHIDLVKAGRKAA